MATNKLIFSNQYRFELATNLFVNVPIILKYNDIDLISVIRETTVAYTTKIPIFHSDGTHLADAKGSRLYTTEIGKKAGLKIDQYPNLWVGKMNGKTLFEIKQREPGFFKTTAELFTNDGYFIKSYDTVSLNILEHKEYLKIGGSTMERCTISNCPVGIWIKKNNGID